METTISHTDEENRQIADHLREAAQLLADQGANPYRVAAYRASADTIESLDEALRARFDAGGVDALGALPAVGAGVAQAIAELLVSGRWRLLDRLRGDAERVSAFEAVPGIGHGLALRIHDQLQIDTLEELERAARSGQLEAIAGVGPRRAAGIRAALDGVLSRRRRWQGHARDAGLGTEPPVELLLYIDRLYRNKAAAGMLPTLVPRRLNADVSVSPPVMHMTKGGWHFTALAACPARAQEPSATADWVALYFYDATQREQLRTVVTGTLGALAGKRVVRGREMECRVYHAG
ncbi:TPA: DNA-binding protein [Burkholderia vietnamiensis]|uniref:DNA-binding protein n=1 Tax=Burkholderia vietnamiensis TaxID=60552 RepID=A0AA45BF96_BURVI|nr:helix-hairpin-helix domain-containing protein [Burkholderia vietnamiensis]KVS18232.1 DNA-binding protein [Burkholderia vietnamiensis]MCA8209824.1 DNA-binding protein [Burkholderia vietnamiensis]PRH43243.1 DNA-binding protein [Burkholderia vietnamiensis]HDR9098109.1 DNA-binding protein [Burkholderia vietnamiensis]HDR9118894.1 DNA-binding protein [Burkholderia vietnamiensis]